MKHKSAILGFSYLTGLICASFIREAIKNNNFLNVNSISSYLYLICAVLVFISFITLLLTSKRSKSFTLSMLMLGLGFGIFGIYEQNFCQPLYELENKTLDVSGRVVSKTDPHNDTSAYIIESDINGTTARFSLYGLDSNAENGDTVNLTVRFFLFNDNAVFSEESYYSSKGILLKATALSNITVKKAEIKNPINYIYEYNTYIKNRILTLMPDDTGAWICALFLGDKSRMSAQLNDDIKRSGISHYTSVSGLHLTIISHLFMLLLECTAFKSKRKFKFIFLSLLILAFMFFFNLTPSVIRSGVMLLVYYGGGLFLRRTGTLNSLGFALFIIILVSPYACRDIGLLFSISGTFGIGVLAPALNKKIKSKHFKMFKEMMISTTCAVYCTLPFTAVFFKGISTVSLITNIIFQPFFMIVLVMMFVFTFSGGVLILPVFIAGIMSRLMITVVEFFGEFKYSYLPLEYDFMIPWAITSFIFIIAVYLIKKQFAVKAGVITVFTLSGMIIWYNYVTIDDTVLRVYSDGGAGVVILQNRTDCIIVITDDSENAAIYADGFIKNHFLDKASILCLLGSTKNAPQLIEAIPSENYVAPQTDSRYDLNDKFTLYTENGKARIKLLDNNFIIEIANIKQEETARNEVDLLILYGYKLNKIEIERAETVIYINKRMPVINEDKDNIMTDRNAYFDEVKYILK